MTARWYVIHVYSGFERKVAQLIREQANKKGMGEIFEEHTEPCIGGLNWLAKHRS